MNGENLTINSNKYIQLPKNIIIFTAALVSFSLWLAATVNTPKKLDNIDERLSRAEHNYAALEAKINSAAQDIRDIKNFLMKKRND